MANDRFLESYYRLEAQILELVADKKELENNSARMTGENLNLRKEVLYTLRRIQNCWEHHLDGSDIRGRKWASHLFSLVFNDMPKIISDKSNCRTKLMLHEKNELEHNTYLSKL